MTFFNYFLLNATGEVDASERTERPGVRAPSRLTAFDRRSSANERPSRTKICEKTSSVYLFR